MPTPRPLLSLLLVVLTFVAVVIPARAAPAAPRITRIHVVKSTHRLELFAGDELVGTYLASLGPGGAGPKTREGDRVTPVGRYHVVMHQPSQYRVFLRLDYPNADDRARFADLKRRGVLPADATIGGDIGIHGPPVRLEEDDKRALRGQDWTLGCVAVMDDEIRDIARRVADGTPVDIDD